MTLSITAQPQTPLRAGAFAPSASSTATATMHAASTSIAPPPAVAAGTIDNSYHYVAGRSLSAEQASLVKEGHLPLRSFPTDPAQLDPAKDDVTAAVAAFIDNAFTPYANASLPNKLKAFLKHFPDGAAWDSQASAALPGQQMSPAANGTLEQYAYFKGQPVRAGYISNYIFGYACQQLLGNPLAQDITWLPGLIAKVYARLHHRTGDDPDDQQAIRDGCQAALQNA